MSVFNMSLENNIKDLDNNIKEKLEYIDIYAKSKVEKTNDMYIFLWASVETKV